MSVLILVAWAMSIAVLVNRSYVTASANLATDLARYGSNATRVEYGLARLSRTDP